MAKSADHYWLRDFCNDLIEIGESASVQIIKDVGWEVEQAEKRRKALVAALWEQHKETIKPRLRPCHQRRFESLNVSIWKD